jgi:hypothetical protein
MKTKKALKKLVKVEAVLSTIIEQYDTDGQRSLHDTLTSAKQAVIHAKDTVTKHQAESKTVKKPPAKAAASRRRRARAVAAG